MITPVTFLASMIARGFTHNEMSVIVKVSGGGEASV